MLTFCHSEEIAKTIMELPFIEKLSEKEKEQLSHQMSRFRTQVINDVEQAQQRTISMLKSKAEAYYK